jgi:hypothetical protein
VIRDYRRERKGKKIKISKEEIKKIKLNRVNLRNQQFWSLDRDDLYRRSKYNLEQNS